MKRLAVVLLVVAVSAGLAGCGGGGGERDLLGPSEPRHLTATEVQRLARVQFPPGTVLVDTSYVGFQDWSLRAVFRLPAGALPGFLSGSGLPQPTPGLRAVTPTPAPARVSGIDQSSAPVEGVFRRALFDLDDPARTTVHLVAFTT